MKGREGTGGVCGSVRMWYVVWHTEDLVREGGVGRERKGVCRRGAAYVVTNGTGQEIRTAGERIEPDRNG